MRVYATCDLGSEAMGRIRSAGIELEVHGSVDPPLPIQIREKVAGGIDGLVTTLRDPIDADILEAGSETLRVVAQCAVGLDNVDVATATRLGITVTHTPDVLTAATAEFALFALGSLARKLEPSERVVREARWGSWHPFLPFLGNEVRGMTIGVIGLGRIGRAFALRCTGLGVDLLLHDPNHQDLAFVRSLEHIQELQAAADPSVGRRQAQFVDWETLITRSDAISLHVPLRIRDDEGPSTHHLIDTDALQRMKKGALLVNTSRGPVVDEAAIAASLHAGHLGGAALDVFATEPLPCESPLLDPNLRDRLRLFHHFGSGTETTRLSPDPDVGMAGRCVGGLLAVLTESRGVAANLPYIANPETLEN